MSEENTEETLRGCVMGLAEIRPMLRLVGVPKGLRNLLNAPFCLFIDTVRGPLRIGDETPVVLTDAADLRRILSDGDLLRREIFGDIDARLAPPAKLRKGKGPRVAQRISPEDVPGGKNLMEMDPFSGVLLYAEGDGSRGLAEAVLAMRSPSMFCSVIETAHIMRGASEAFPGVDRTLSGTFLFKYDNETVQVQASDTRLFLKLLMERGELGVQDEESDFCALVRAAGPMRAVEVMDELSKGRTLKRDSLPAALQAAHEWGEAAFSGKEKIHLTILHVGGGGEVGTFAADNAEHFQRFWAERLRDVMNDPERAFMINKRVFTNMTEPETGLPIKRLSSFVLNRDGMIPLPKDKLREAFRWNARTGEPLPAQPDIVFSDFNG